MGRQKIRGRRINIRSRIKVGEFIDFINDIYGINPTEAVNDMIEMSMSEYLNTLDNRATEVVPKQPEKAFPDIKPPAQGPAPPPSPPAHDELN